MNLKQIIQKDIHEILKEYIELENILIETPEIEN